jgi:hypothetical protein
MPTYLRARNCQAGDTTGFTAIGFGRQEVEFEGVGYDRVNDLVAAKNPSCCARFELNLRRPLSLFAFDQRERQPKAVSRRPANTRLDAYYVKDIYVKH